MPDESSLLRFRHRLQKHKLAEQILVTGNDLLIERSLLLKTDTVVDARSGVTWHVAMRPGKRRALGAGAVKQSPGHLGHQRGRPIPLEMKQMAIQLITEAMDAGARSHKACGVLGIRCRTLRRWSEPTHQLSDQRGRI
jgi:hypothetical protein